MSASGSRVVAVMGKELAEFRRNRLIVASTAFLPVMFLASPTVSILLIKASAPSTVLDQRVDASLFIPLLIPVLVPALLSAYSVVGERDQGTLEPGLTTPVSRAELLLGKAAAIFLPAVAIAYLVFGVFVAITQVAARPAVARAVWHAPQLPAALAFIPLLAPWAISVGLALSAPVPARPGLHPAAGRLGHVVRPGHLGPRLRHPRRPAAVGPGQPAADRADRAGVGPPDQPDLRARRRPGRRAAGRRRHRLPGRGPVVRPRTTGHRPIALTGKALTEGRKQCQPKRNQKGPSWPRSS